MEVIELLSWKQSKVSRQEGASTDMGTSSKDTRATEARDPIVARSH